MGAANLAEFLRTGLLGPLRYGLTKVQAAALLGQPTGRSKLRNPAVWRWGALELTFLDEKLTAMGLLFMDGQPFPATIPWEGWMPARATEVREFESYVKGAKLPFAEDPGLTFKTQVGIRVGPLATVIFSRSGALTQLESIHRQER